jgi:polyamine oxidase
LKTHYSDYSNFSTFNEKGFSDYKHLQNAYDKAYDIASKEAGVILSQNLQDQTGQTGLAMGGWFPDKHDMEAQAIEWWNWGMYALSSVE